MKTLFVIFALVACALAGGRIKSCQETMRSFKQCIGVKLTDAGIAFDDMKEQCADKCKPTVDPTDASRCKCMSDSFDDCLDKSTASPLLGGREDTQAKKQDMAMMEVKRLFERQDECGKCVKALIKPEVQPKLAEVVCKAHDDCHQANPHTQQCDDDELTFKAAKCACETDPTAQAARAQCITQYGPGESKGDHMMPDANVPCMQRTWKKGPAFCNAN